jgi:tetratricopeptide (TPR) repeat protein
MRSLVALIVCILCVISSVRVIAADKQQILEEVSTCAEDGTCESPWATIQKIISYNIDDGSLTINSQQTYKEPFKQYGVDVARHLREIVKDVNSLELLDENNFDNYVHMILSMTDDLSALAAVHKLEWLYGSSDNSVDAVQSKSFDKTLSICKAVMRLFNLLQSHAETNEVETIEYISTGISSAALVLGDLFQLRPSIDSSAIIKDDFSTAYQYFTFAESTIVKSLSSMSIDKNGDLIIANGDGSNVKQEDDAYLLVLDDVLTVHASISLRFGSLLLEMHFAGFTLDIFNNLHFDASGFATNQAMPSGSDGVVQQLSENQKHILQEAFAKLETSTVVNRKLQHHNSFQLPHHDDVETSLYDLADAYSRMGIINSLLQEWSLSAKNCKTGLSMLSVYVDGFQSEEVVASLDDMIVTMITITQSLFESYLHLPGEIESAKDAFRTHLLARKSHLLVRKAAETGDLGDIFGKELTNADEEEVRQLLLLNKDAIQPIVDSAQVQESLNMYQNMLEETLRKQQENPAGIHYSELDIDGGAAYDAHDNLYEGSLRSVIGSLYLDLNQPWKARDELENAVRLLGEGIELVDSGKYEVIGDDGNPLNYSLRLDLAHVLHSLSYTYLALMQWQKSYDAFEDAMDIYQSELSEGESPMEWNSIATTTESSSTSMTDRLLKYFFRETEEDRIDLQDFQQGQNVTA